MSSSRVARTALLRRMDDICAKQAALERDRLEVCASLNAIAPIHLLLLELIIDILLRIYDSVFTYHDSPRSIWISRWLQIPSVCRYWRDVVFSTPAFWRCIKVGAAPEWLSLSLTHARNGPTEIYFRGDFPWKELAAIMLPHKCSISLIDILDLPVAAVTHLDPLFTTSIMPALVTLRIKLEGIKPKSAISLSRRNIPNLTSLTLHHFRLLSNVSLYANLHHLYLKRCLWPVNLAEFLAILAASPNLTSLNLVGCLLAGFEHASEPTSVTIPITLPGLHTLILEQHSLSVTACALRYLCIPNATSLSITGDLGEQYEEDITETITGMFPAHAASSIFPMLKSAHAAELSISDDIFDLTVRNAAGARVRLGVYSTWVDIWEDGRSTLLGLNDVLAVCRDAPLTSLHLHGFWDQVHPDKWEEVFMAFPALEELALSGYGWASAIFSGLRQASEAMPAGQCCPDLRVISLDGLDGRKDTFPAMEYENVVDALRVRVELGYPPLETLQLHLEQGTVEYEENYEHYFDQFSTWAHIVSFTMTQ